jgi:hypothetical protein
MALWASKCTWLHKLPRCMGMTLPRLTGRYVRLQAPSITTRRAGHRSEVLNNKMHIMGGYGGVGNEQATVLNTTEVFDLKANAWRDGPAMEFPRAFGNSGVLDGYLFVFGGLKAVWQITLFVKLSVVAGVLACQRHHPYWARIRGPIVYMKQGGMYRRGRQERPGPITTLPSPYCFKLSSHQG